MNPHIQQIIQALDEPHSDDIVACAFVFERAIETVRDPTSKGWPQWLVECDVSDAELHALVDALVACWDRLEAAEAPLLPTATWAFSKLYDRAHPDIVERVLSQVTPGIDSDANHQALIALSNFGVSWPAGASSSRIG